MPGSCERGYGRKRRRSVSHVTVRETRNDIRAGLRATLLHPPTRPRPYSTTPARLFRASPRNRVLRLVFEKHFAGSSGTKLWLAVSPGVALRRYRGGEMFREHNRFREFRISRRIRARRVRPNNSRRFFQARERRTPRRRTRNDARPRVFKGALPYAVGVLPKAYGWTRRRKPDRSPKTDPPSTCRKWPE